MYLRIKLQILLVLTCLQLRVVTAVWTKNCTLMMKTAAALSTKCCLLTVPALDPGYQDCVKEITADIPKDHKLTTTEKTALNVCIEECNFVANGYLDYSGMREPKLDVAVMEDNFENYMPLPKEDTVEFLKNAFLACERFRSLHPARLDVKYPDVDILEKDCNPYALQLTICVRIYGMQQCLPEFFLQTEECEQAQIFYKTCFGEISKDIS